MRPLTDGERISEDGGNITHVRGGGKLSLLDKWAPKEFEFDQAFDVDASQKSIFDDIWPLMRTCADGRNVTVVVHGHANAGKAYTLWGDDESVQGGGSNISREDAAGMVSRALLGLFALRKETAAVYDTHVRISVCEVCGDRVKDLISLNNGSSDPDVKVSLGREGNVIVQNLSEHAVETDKKGASLVKFGVAASQRAAHVVVYVCVQTVSKRDKTVTDGKLVFVKVASHSDVFAGMCMCACACVCVCVYLRMYELCQQMRQDCD